MLTARLRVLRRATLAHGGGRSALARKRAHMRGGASEEEQGKRRARGRRRRPLEKAGMPTARLQVMRRASWAHDVRERASEE